MGGPRVTGTMNIPGTYVFSAVIYSGLNLVISLRGLMFWITILSALTFLFIIQSLFKYYDIYTPLELMHFTSTDRNREVYVMHYIYHYLKNEHLSLVSKVDSLAKVARIYKICFKYGLIVIRKDFPDLLVFSLANEAGRPP